MDGVPFRAATVERQPDAFDAIWANVRERELPPMSMEEINAEMALYRQDRREAQPAWITAMQADAEARGLDATTMMDDIASEIAAHRASRTSK